MPAFQLTALSDHHFVPLFELDEAQLAQLGIRKMIVDAHPGYPCRVSLEDAEIGEEVLLLPYEHHAVDSPYRSSGPIYVRKYARTANYGLNEIPVMLRHRLLSLRAYDENGLMVGAMITPGTELETAIKDFFANSIIQYIHVHNAGPGCYNCQVNRAD